jgi:predicted NAD-dependent protein-ADP-ribosyltransferase YbiA (DUF1768 family)
MKSVPLSVCFGNFTSFRIQLLGEQFRTDEKAKMRAAFIPSTETEKNKEGNKGIIVFQTVEG